MPFFFPALAHSLGNDVLGADVAAGEKLRIVHAAEVAQQR